MRIKSDAPIFDNNNKLVQTHGGSMMYINDTFYWYGENKEGNHGPIRTEEGVIWPLWTNGLKIYSSKDMINWKDEGFLKRPSENPWNPFYPTFIIDRPHIIYCPKTKKYVCWTKTSFDIYNHTGFSICVGDKPFDMKYKELVIPAPHYCGDFDLFVYKGKGYIIYTSDNCITIVRELTDDYENLTDNFKEQIAASYPPFTREAPCVFERNNRLFMLTSGTTGYFPNRTKCHEITDLFGKWKDLGYICKDDKENNSYRCQFSSVFKHPYKKDLYIAIGDRWLVDLPKECPDIEYLFERIYNPKRDYDFVPYEIELNKTSKQDLSKATYVMLPIKFNEDGTPYIEYSKDWEL